MTEEPTLHCPICNQGPADRPDKYGVEKAESTSGPLVSVVIVSLVVFQFFFTLHIANPRNGSELSDVILLPPFTYALAGILLAGQLRKKRHNTFAAGIVGAIIGAVIGTGVTFVGCSIKIMGGL